MKIYLAHNFAAREVLHVVRKELQEKGHEVTSRWLDQHGESDGSGKYALEDFEDIDSCDVMIHFADQFGMKPGKGKFIEFGYAFAKGKKLVLIATPAAMTSVFYRLPNVSHFEDIISYMETI